MTRVKEPPVGTSDLPDYKSHPSRILRSLRQGYDHLREKVSKKSEMVIGLQGKLRDTQESRDNWKQRARIAESEIERLKLENEKLKEDLKKNL